VSIPTYSWVHLTPWACTPRSGNSGNILKFYLLYLFLSRIKSFGKVKGKRHGIVECILLYFVKHWKTQIILYLPELYT
jgi:hypothetical protein